MRLGLSKILLLITAIVFTSSAICLDDIRTGSFDLLHPDVEKNLASSDSAFNRIPDIDSLTQQERAELGSSYENSLALIDKCEPRPLVLADELAKGLALLRLAELGKHGALTDATSFLSEAVNDYPHCRIFAWMNARAKACGGDIFGAISIYDSLQSDGFGDSSFFADYSGSVFAVLVPQRDGGAAENFFVRGGNISDSIGKVLHSWNSGSRTLGKKRLPPAFSFTNAIPIRTIHLGTKCDTRHRKLPDSSFVVGGAAFTTSHCTLGPRSDTLSCKLFIDLDASCEALPGYIYHKIDWCYDSVETHRDVKKFGGTSLRCFNTPFYGTRGRFSALASFDLPARMKPGRKDVRPVRYTLVVQSSMEQRLLVEKYFNAILKAFL